MTRMAQFLISQFLKNTSVLLIIVVFTAPPHTLEPSMNFVETTSGDDIELDCIDSDMYGYPPPSINWTFNDSPVNVSGILPK